MCIAVPGLLAAHLVASNDKLNVWLFVACGILELVLLIVSRGTLKTYYTRASHLLGTEQQKPLLGGRKPEGKPSQNRRTKQAETTQHTSIGEKTAEQVDDRAKPGVVARW